MSRSPWPRSTASAKRSAIAVTSGTSRSWRSAAKLVVNSTLFGALGVLGEALALAEGLGLAPEVFLDAIAGGPLDAGYAQAKGRGMIEREFPPAFPLRHALKDLRLVEDAAGRHELDVPLVAAIAERFAQGVAAGHGDLDMSATFLAGR